MPNQTVVRRRPGATRTGALGHAKAAWMRYDAALAAGDYQAAGTAAKLAMLYEDLAGAQLRPGTRAAFRGATTCALLPPEVTA